MREVVKLFKFFDIFAKVSVGSFPTLMTVKFRFSRHRLLPPRLSVIFSCPGCVFVL